MPIVNEQQLEGYDFLQKRYNHGTFVFGALKPGVTVQQAFADLNNVAAQLAKQYPDTNDQMGIRLGAPGLFGDILGDAAREFLTGVMLLALLVLVAACVNLASIFAARAADRNRELAIRLAIRSSPWRVLRQVVAEAALLSIAGGLIAALVANTLMRFLTEWHPIAAYPIHGTVMPDWHVYALAILLAAASGILLRS